MRRREFVLLACSAVAASDALARSKNRARYTVGFLNGGSRPPDISNSLYGAFAKGMRRLGWVEGQDYEIEYRFAEGRYEMFPALAKELVDQNVDVILLGAMAATRPAQHATSTIPIVMGNSIDPVGNGLIASLAHPGGNTTGLSSAYEDVFPKLVEIIRLTIPNIIKNCFRLKYAKFYPYTQSRNSSKNDRRYKNRYLADGSFDLRRYCSRVRSYRRGRL